jgi:hypothetical protein
MYNTQLLLRQSILKFLHYHSVLEATEYKLHTYPQEPLNQNSAEHLYQRLPKCYNKYNTFH